MTLRWHILRTLLYKEVLRYRYNWGLLVVVAALLSLSAMVALSSRLSQVLTGQAGSEISICKIYHSDRPISRRWAEHLRMNPPANVTLEFLEYPVGTPVEPRVKEGEMLIMLSTPPGLHDFSTPPSQGWKVRYWCADEEAPGTYVIRYWFESATADFLGAAPRVVVENKQAVIQAGAEKTEVLSLIVTAFAIFALYLLSFNLFITSAGEEREKKVLLGLLLSPASAEEVLAAKAIFYGTGSLFVSLAVVGMYSPVLLLRPLLWLTVMCGSVSYVAIGTVILSVVRRQTTINTLSILYLMAMTIVMILSQFLLPFQFMQWIMMENYLFALMKKLVDGQYHPWMLWNAGRLLGLAIAWCIIAIVVFRRNATSIARAR